MLMAVRKKSPINTVGHKHAQQVDTEQNKQMADKDKLADKLYLDIKELHVKVERISNERNEAIEKFSESEKYWRQKQGKADREYQSLYEMNQSIKEDNNSLLGQLDKFNKRIKQLEGESLREQDTIKVKDNQIAELGR